MSNKSSGQQVQYWYHRLEERCIYLCVEEYIPLRIAELCRKRGYTKYRLAQLTGITQTALGNMLNQKSMPTMANLEKIWCFWNYNRTIFFRWWKQIESDKRAKRNTWDLGWLGWEGKRNFYDFYPQPEEVMDSSTKMRAVFFIWIYIKYAFYTHEEIDRKFRGGV